MDAKRDANRISTLLGVSNADGLTPVTIWADPVTHRLLVDYTGGTVSVDVGATTTLAPGTSATVVNTGDTSNAVFAFSIPRGAEIYAVTSIPDNGTGLDGDWAFDTTSNSYVWYKSSGVWALVNSNKGSQGIQGIQGIQGLKGLNWQGTYNAGTPYVIDDAVAYLGTSYICIQNGTGQTPATTGTAYWDVLALKGDNGVGSGTVTSVAAITLGTTGTDLSSTVANGTTTPVITLQVPTASVSNRGVLSPTDWSTFNAKQDSLGFTPEDVANKATDGTLGTSDTLYPSQKAVKTYVDNLALGLVPKPSAHAATTTTLPTNTYSNGASGVGATLTAITVGVLTVDGIALALNDYVLVKDETIGYTNGLYVVTTAGAVGVAYILTRDVTMDTTTEFSNSLIVVENGTANAGTLWLCSNNGSITVGTTVVTFANIPTAGAPIAGTGISVSGLTIAIDSTVATLAGTQTLTNKTIDGVTPTTMGYVDPTSSIQTQLNGKLPLAGGTMTGDITLGENTSIALDPAGSADGKYSGITITATAGATLAFGDLIYLAAATSKWVLTDADASATGGPVIVGMCVLAANDTQATKILLQGQIRADAKFPTLTVGGSVYLGETAGAIQVAIPTGADNVIRVVGFALTADEIYFNPSQDHQITVA